MIEVRVPGRINLIGDHTDYTGGLVLPTVVDLHTVISGRITNEAVWRLESLTHGPAAIPLDLEVVSRLEQDWARYPAAVLGELRTLGIAVPGFTGTISTDLPIGGGLSSSAALEVATLRVALGLVEASSLPAPHLSDIDVARLCQRAEHAATAVPCGIMDQLSIVLGRPGSATLIDCGSLSTTMVPLPESIRIEHRFITPRTLVGSEYSERVDQCRRIEDVIGPLRTATMSDISRLDSDLLRRRARHVISENSRVRLFVEALARGEDDVAGALMIESHRSLSSDFETSTPAMDAAVDSVLAEKGVLGARMTGGGFGGCIVILRRS